MAGVALGSIWLVASARERAATPGTLAPRIVRLSDIPSHGRGYRATLIPAPGAIERGRPLRWTLDVRTAAGAPVRGAALAVESWTPDDEKLRGRQPHVTAELGQGRYRLDDLRFDRSGWWNVKLRISAGGTTDSLAFNLVLQ